MKLRILCLMLCMLIFAGCSTTTNNDAGQNVEEGGTSLDDYLLDISLTMADKVKRIAQNTDALSSFYGESEALQLLQEFTIDTQGEPETITVITFQPEAITRFLKTDSSDIEADAMEQQYWLDGITTAFPQKISANTSANALVATSMVRIAESRIAHPDVHENTIVHMLYKNGRGIDVLFIPSEENTVVIYATFVSVLDEDESDLLNGKFEDFFGDSPVIKVRTLK